MSEATSLLDGTTSTTQGDGGATTTQQVDAKTETTQTTDTTTTQGDGKTVEQPGEKKVEAPAGAPEKYEAFTMPEGFTLDAELAAEFEPTLRELNLSQDNAQKVIAFAPKLVQTTVERTTAGLLKQMGLADHAKFVETAKTDKEIGGEKFLENVGVANKAMAAFGTPELIAVLKSTGLGNHPEVIRAFYRAGKQISADGFVPGGRTNSGGNNPAQKLYDKSEMNP